MKNIIEKKELRNNGRLTIKEVKSQLDRLVKGQEINQKELRLGFIGLAKQNQELLDLNNQLSEQFKKVVEELDTLKKEREEKEIRKQARAKRKRLPKRDPITSEIYNRLIQESQSPTYIARRICIAFCILTVTGIFIAELLPLKVGQLETLLHEHWILIDLLKRANHKAFLTTEGKKIVQDRNQDFKYLLAMKDKNSYVFTAEATPNQMLGTQTITMDINKIMRKVSKDLPSKPHITSHSFRIGYISQLWRDTKDIEFVRQNIGHRTIITTSSYIKEIPETERKKRIDEI